MLYRTLGKTGLKVSEIGMGTWQLAGKPWGWDFPDEAESVRALHKYVELGGNFIDSAWVYGRAEDNEMEGKHTSEELIGKFLKESGNRDRVIIATKIPGKNMKWPAWQGIPVSEVFPEEWIEEIVNDSLKNFQVDIIDLVQFHVWQDYFAEEDEWKETIQKLTKQGKVKYWGISINDYQPSNCLKTLDTGLISTIQLIFNIFHQKPIERLFPYAKKNNIGIITRVPLDEGSLAGMVTKDTVFEDEMRSVMFGGERREQVVERVEKLKLLLGEEARTLPELALRWILSFNEVSTVIPGMRKVSKVEQNISVSDGRKLSKELMGKLREHIWERNFYVSHDPALKDSGYVEA